MSRHPSRRSVLAAIGLGTAGLAAGYTGTVTVPRLSPVWERWRSPLDGASLVGQSTTIADGRLFLTSDGRLLALDLDSGDPQWGHHVGDHLRHGVAAGDDAVYVGDQEIAAVGFDGEERWRVTLGRIPALDERAILVATPVVADGRLFVTADDGLVAFDAAAGGVLWTAPLDQRVEALATDGTSLYVALHRDDATGGFVRAFDPATGTRRWEATVEDDAIGFATGDALYCAVGDGGAGGEGVVALDFDDGDRRWTYDLPLTNGVTLHDETVYATAGAGSYNVGPHSGTPNGAVVALDAQTGEERWYTPAESYGQVAPGVTDDGVYVSTTVTGPDTDGAVIAYTADGEHRWTYPTGEDARPVTTPRVSDGTVYVAGGDAALALDEREW
ncbi:PQQ-binding-like beta-propeller repeat protein [Halobacteriaceae archaeon GCM10025711]